MEDQKPAMSLSSIIFGLASDRVVVDVPLHSSFQTEVLTPSGGWPCSLRTAHSSAPGELPSEGLLGNDWMVCSGWGISEGPNLTLALAAGLT